MLIADNLQKRYETRRWRNRHVVEAVRGVSLTVNAGETVGLVGESGCGKSTLGRCLAFLEPLSGGSIRYGDRELSALSFEEARQLRRQVQIIFQDPVDSLNPRLTVEQIVMEPLNHFGIGSRQDRYDLVRQYIHRVGLRADHLGRFPAELSRGQCQRVNIARTLVLDPKIIICDEIISALDVSVGVQILQLLRDLQEEKGYGYLFISHDLARVVQVSHRIAVMYMGRIVEECPGWRFHLEARHPYSRMLLSAVPQPFRTAEERYFVPMVEEMLHAGPQTIGCGFAPRCPLASPACREVDPELLPVSAEHRVACHEVTHALT